jgi:hypothetical protein
MGVETVVDPATLSMGAALSAKVVIEVPGVVQADIVPEAWMPEIDAIVQDDHPDSFAGGPPPGFARIDAHPLVSIDRLAVSVPSVIVEGRRLAIGPWRLGEAGQLCSRTPPDLHVVRRIEVPAVVVFWQIKIEDLQWNGSHRFNPSPAYTRTVLSRFGGAHSHSRAALWKVSR